MSDLLKALLAAPPGIVMILIGAAFLVIAAVGRVKDKFNPGRRGRIFAGVVGTLLVSAGLVVQLTTRPSPESPVSTTASVATPAPVTTAKTGGWTWTNLASSAGRNDSPQFSPDGTRIAFQSNRSGNQEIWICDQRCTSPAQLTHFGGPIVGSPRWSPFGDTIAFDCRCSSDAGADIYLVPASGGEPKRFTSDPADEVRPSWSRDGAWIYFGSNRPPGQWQVWKKPVGGGAEKQVTRAGGREAFEGSDALYYAKQETPGIWKVPAGGGPERALVGEGEQGGWALGEHGVYYLHRTNSGISVALFGDEPSIVASLPDDGGVFHGLSVSRDENAILYVREAGTASTIAMGLRARDKPR